MPGRPAHASAPAQVAVPTGQTGQTGQTGTTSGRQVWADVAKGVSILLVVLHHAITKDYLPQVPTELAALGDSWRGITHGLKPVRMPLFFVVSGLFAAGAVRRPWAESWRRPASPYYLYVVWLLVLGAVFSVERTLPMNRTQDLGELAMDLVWASTGVWFLYALAVYFLVARLVRGLPTPVVLAGAVGVAVLGSLLPIDEVNRQAVLLHLVHFLIGVRLPGLLRSLAGLTRLRWAAALVAAYVGGSVLVEVLDPPRGIGIVALSLLGVPGGIVLAALVAQRSRARGPLAWVGQRTLPIYVMHVPLLALVHHSGLGATTLTGPFAPLWVAAYPLLVTGLIVASCLLLHRALLALGLTWFFELPRLRRRAQAEADTASR